MKLFSGMLCIILLASCTHVSAPINEITKVEFARSGAWSDRGAAISIDSSLEYKYYGRTQNVELRYYYTGKITTQFWDTLNKKLENANFRTAADTDTLHVEDVNYFEIIVHWRNGKRRIVRMENHDTKDSLSKTMLWINNSYNTIKLSRIADPIKFETRFQDPPKPQIDQVKFPPPIKRPNKNNNY